MTEILAILLLTTMQFAAGYGVIRRFRLSLKRSVLIPLGIITGIAVFSLVPLVLQLFFISITRLSVFAGLLLLVLLLNPGLKYFREMAALFRRPEIHFRLYELPAAFLVLLLVVVSVWRCYYLPPTPRDLTSGPEVIASYAVQEKTMINSVFEIDLSTTNNQYKSPFISALQVIYKFAGFPFGQVWLSSLFVFFLVMLYHLMRLYVHRLIAWLLLVFFLFIPEMYAYTFMALFDLPNAIFFFTACWFFLEYFTTGERNQLAAAGFFMAMATYIRSETLVFAFFLLPALAWYHIRNWHGLTLIIKNMLVLVVPSLIFYLITVVLYNQYYLPSPYEVSHLVNRNLLNPLPLINRFVDMNFALIFSRQGIIYYGYFIFLFLLVMVFDSVFYDRSNRLSRNWLYTILVIYLGYPVLGFLLPLLDIDHSTKRGFFKLFPLMLFYMASCSLMKGMSRRLDRFESSTIRATSP